MAHWTIRIKGPRYVPVCPQVICFANRFRGIIEDGDHRGRPIGEVESNLVKR